MMSFPEICFNSIIRYLSIITLLVTTHNMFMGPSQADNLTIINQCKFISTFYVFHCYKESLLILVITMQLIAI